MSSHYISSAKRRARKLKLDFDLDAKFLWKLYEKQDRKCALSGVPISFSMVNKRRAQGTISLDRIESDKGYTRNNVQWVHKNVNLMKMYLSQEVFIDFCEKICHHSQLT